MKLIDSHNIDFNKLKIYFGKKVKLFDVINLINSQPTVYPKESVCSHWVRCWNYKECFICDCKGCISGEHKQNMIICNLNHIKTPFSVEYSSTILL